MEPPSKRLRLDPPPYSAGVEEENQDELSMTPAQFDASQDPIYQLDKGRAKAATRLKSALEDIFEKYSKDFDGDDDVVNFYTEEFEVDNGHVESLESWKDAAAKDSPSSNEEGSILSGKSGGRGKRQKLQSKSLTRASHPKHKPDPSLHLNSPWNGAPGLGTYRLSSLAFSTFPYNTPYNAHLPFDFGPSPFGKSPIDPVWQAPDLPVQPHRHYAPLIGAAGSQFDPFGARPHDVAKRLVTAKSFLLRTASTSSVAKYGEVGEEDDILLGGNKQDKLLITRSRVPGKTRMPVTSSAISNPSSQSPSQQPPFYGIDLTNNSAHNQPEGLGKESIQDKAMERAMTETFSASHQPAEENTQLRQAAGSSRSLSPSPPKRGRPKKSDTHKSATFHSEEPKPKFHPLQPNERRIEIIIPMMKRLFPTETAPKKAAEDATPVVDKIPQELHMEQSISIDESREIPHIQDSPHTIPAIGSHEGVMFHQPSPDSAGKSRDANTEFPIQTSESPKIAPRPLDLQYSQKRRPKRIRKQTELPIPHTPHHDEQGLETIIIGGSLEPKSSQTEADNSADDSVTDSLHQIKQKSGCDNETDRMAPDQQRPPIADVDVDEHAAHNTNIEQSVKATPIKEHNLEVTSCRSPSPTERLHEGAADGTIEISDPATTVAIVSDTVMSQELKSSHYENEDLPQGEPDPVSVDSNGEESFCIHPHAPNSEAPCHDQQAGKMLGISEIMTSDVARIPPLEQNVGSRSPKHPAVRETTEPDLYQGEDCLLPSFEPPRTCEHQEHDASDQPLFSSVLVAEIDGLQLDSDPPGTERSSSPQAIELPDQDLSAFPAEPDRRFTSELALRLSSSKTQADAQHNTGIGRSPSPELGTPIGPEIISEATSRINDSPTLTPTRKRGGAKPRSSHRRTPSSKRFPLSSLIPGGIDDESDDELSIAGSFSSTMSRFHSPFSRSSTNDNIDLPPLFSTPRKPTRKNGLLTGSPSHTRTPNRIIGLDRGGNMHPATDSRASRSQSRRGRNRAVHSSPLARRVAERLLSSPTKKHRATPQRPPSLVASPHGTLRRCGEDGFVCERVFCLTCCK
ncbi:hypothetical protein F4801DRAFT_567785 [Xylaria longipes]|nr:hypothetical protein F4801DRAFT_567785 [Xylaria longipes]